MGWFARDFFQTSPMLLYPIVALLIFISIFAVVAVRTMRMKKGDVDAMARLAVGDETVSRGKEAIDG